MNVQDWFGGMGFLQFLREVGKHARVNVMLSRESVRTRLEREDGISFTECVLFYEAYSVPANSNRHYCQQTSGTPSTTVFSECLATCGGVPGALQNDMVAQGLHCVLIARP